MRIPDELLGEWYRLVMESDEDPLAGDPMEAKLRLARFVVARSHGEEAADAAEAHFTRVVREGQAPEEVPEVVAARRRRRPSICRRVLAEHLGVFVDERGPPADRRRRRQVDGAAGDGARRAGGAPERGCSCRPESAVCTGFRPVRDS